MHCMQNHALEKLALCSRVREFPSVFTLSVISISETSTLLRFALCFFSICSLARWLSFMLFRLFPLCGLMLD